MLNKEKVFILLDKVNNDYDYYIDNTWLELDARQIIDNAYDIFHAQNCLWHIEYMCENYEDDDIFWLTEDTVDKIINFKGNFISHWVNHRYDYRHSERYNLENIEDFTNALEIVMGNVYDN